MASEQGFVDWVLDQIHPSCDPSAKKMFGEYGLYSHGKLVGLICDNRLYMKPTEGGRSHIGRVQEAPAYPGAKPSFLIGDDAEDSDWLTELVRLTADELPDPKPKKKRTAKRKRA